MNEYTLRKLIAELVYEKDIRLSPDNFRRGQFKVNWKNATVRGKIYTVHTLKKLTWHNLGYRLGNKIGDKPPDEIYRIFDLILNLGKDASLNKIDY